MKERLHIIFKWGNRAFANIPIYKDYETQLYNASSGRHEHFIDIVLFLRKFLHV